jgi:type IX secretion system PorP/SprF family membrane protein
MKLRLLVLLSFLTFAYQSIAQEGIPVYFDYLADNYYLVYPSMAGIGEGGKVRATARQQWFSVDEAPNLQTLNANFRLGDSNSGVGAIIFNDANGYHSMTGVKLTYAYHLKIGGDERYLNQISFGLSPTYLQSKLDETSFRSILNDPAIVGSNISQGYFNMDLGFSYSKMEFYAHFGVLNILGSERELYRFGRVDGNLPVIDNARRYLASAGYIFGRSEWQVEPSILFQISEFNYQSENDPIAVGGNQKTIDINAKVYRDVDFGRVWGGVSYRRSFDGAQFQSNGSFGEQRLQLVTPIVGANIGNFLVSYNYSYQMGDIRFDNGGFHQITLGYDFGQTERKYDCYCPAAQ